MIVLAAVCEAGWSHFRLQSSTGQAQLWPVRPDTDDEADQPEAAMTGNPCNGAPSTMTRTGYFVVPWMYPVCFLNH